MLLMKRLKYITRKFRLKPYNYEYELCRVVDYCKFFTSDYSYIDYD